MRGAIHVPRLDCKQDCALRSCLVTVVEEALHKLRLIFDDDGPGIPDIEQALRDGYTTGTGLGMGLGGARRLVNEFRIESKPGGGTRIVATRWR